MRNHVVLRLLAGLTVAGLALTGCTEAVDGTASPDPAGVVASAQTPTAADDIPTLPPDRVVHPDPDAGVVPADTLVNPDAYRVESLDAYVWQSPTGNIRCELLQAPEVALGCTVLEHTLTPAAGCTADQPATATISGGQVVQGCRTDAPEGLVLAYGDTIDLDNFACSSAEDGMTCTAGTQSFRISRASLDLQQ